MSRAVRAPVISVRAAALLQVRLQELPLLRCRALLSSGSGVGGVALSVQQLDTRRTGGGFGGEVERFGDWGLGSLGGLGGGVEGLGGWVLGGF